MELVSIGLFERSIGKERAVDLLRLAAESRDESLPPDDRVVSWCGYITGIIKVCGTPGVDVREHNVVYNSAYCLALPQRKAIVEFDDSLWRDLSRLTIGAERFDTDPEMSLYEAVKKPDWRVGEHHSLRTQLFSEIRLLEIS